MSETEKGCQCGCNAMTVVTRATKPCACGCECCSNEQLPKRADEIAQLEHLRESVEARLTELAKS